MYEHTAFPDENIGIEMVNYCCQMLKYGAHVDDRDGLTDMTMLHYACKSGARGVGNAEDACQVVKMLLSHGADPYIRCRWTNMAAIHYAAYFDVSPVVDVLLEFTKASGWSDILCIITQQNNRYSELIFVTHNSKYRYGECGHQASTCIVSVQYTYFINSLFVSELPYCVAFRHKL